MTPCSVATSVTSPALASVACARRCERRLDALGAQLEVGLLVEHVLEQRRDRRARAATPTRAGGLAADARQVAVEPVEGLERCAASAYGASRLSAASRSAMKRPVSAR